LQELKKRNGFHRLQSRSDDYDILDVTIKGENTTISSYVQSARNEKSLALQDKESMVIPEDERNEYKTEAPTVGKILKFAVPAIGVWLCSPLLSLIDTSAVGILSGTIQQAALNPAVAVTDYAALIIAFLYTGTTNLVGVARSREENDPEKDTTTSTMIGAL
jgi:hypothetical protein